MGKIIPGLVLALLLVCAGCSENISASKGDTAKPTTEPAPSGTVVEYRSLNDTQQSAFRDALQSEVSFHPDVPYINESRGYDSQADDPFLVHDYVRYDGALYQVRTERGELYASYSLRASIGSPPDQSTVVGFDSLPDRIRDEVRTAITDGGYHAPFGKWDSLPEPLGDTEYIRYGNRTYEMRYIVGDAYETVLTVEEVE